MLNKVATNTQKSVSRTKECKQVKRPADRYARVVVDISVFLKAKEILRRYGISMKHAASCSLLNFINELEKNENRSN